MKNLNNMHEFNLLLEKIIHKFIDSNFHITNVPKENVTFCDMRG